MNLMRLIKNFSKIQSDFIGNKKLYFKNVDVLINEINKTRSEGGFPITKSLAIKSKFKFKKSD